MPACAEDGSRSASAAHGYTKQECALLHGHGQRAALAGAERSGCVSAVAATAEAKCVLQPGRLGQPAAVPGASRCRWRWSSMPRPLRRPGAWITWTWVGRPHAPGRPLPFSHSTFLPTPPLSQCTATVTRGCSGVCFRERSTVLRAGPQRRHGHVGAAALDGTRVLPAGPRRGCAALAPSTCLLLSRPHWGGW